MAKFVTTQKPVIGRIRFETKANVNINFGLAFITNYYSDSKHKV